MSSDRERLLDILEAIDAIERYAVKGRETFDADELIRGWMVQHLQIIVEVAAATSPALREQHPEIRWRGTIAMRNLIVHAYHRVDPDVVSEVVSSDIPVLKRQISAALEVGDA